MRLPIEVALSHPDPPSRRFETLDLTKVGPLTFEPPDRTRFPCLALAEEALAQGGTAPAVLNAADEVCVAEYLEGRIRFSEIALIVEETLAAHVVSPADRLDVLEAADRWARRDAASRMSARKGD
jgi:1-deoxy-D-xylulose-5-phosphate reductoisomerase